MPRLKRKESYHSTKHVQLISHYRRLHLWSSGVNKDIPYKYEDLEYKEKESTQIHITTTKFESFLTINNWRLHTLKGKIFEVANENVTIIDKKNKKDRA